MYLNSLKVIVLSVLLVTTIIFGSLPLFCFTSGGRTGQSPVRDRVFSVLNCLAGGVFFGLCLLDLIPDVTESFEKWDDDVKGFPLGEVTVAVGLLLILIIEQIFSALQQFHSDAAAQDQRKTEEEQGLLSESSTGQDQENFGTFNDNGRRPVRLGGGEGEGEGEGEGGGGRGGGGGGEGEEERAANEEIHGPTVAESGASKVESQRKSASPPSASPHQGVHGHGHHHLTGAGTHESSSGFRSLALLGALSFHSILEGVAIGINPKERDVLTLWLAISIHKSVIAFSLCINFLSTMRKYNAFLCLSFFSLMTPIGTVIGIYLSGVACGTIWQGILQGLATGTFLYITFFELLPREIEVPNDKVLKILAILIGFGIICGLIAFEKFYLSAEDSEHGQCDP